MEVEREVVLDAPPEEVWEALTDPEQLEEWFANDVEFDLEQGGTFRWDDGEVRHAVVEEVETERRLAIRWWDPAGPEESEVTFTLVADLVSTATERYDVGVFLSPDGGSAQTGQTCEVGDLPHPPADNADGDACGDISK